MSILTLLGRSGIIAISVSCSVVVVLGVVLLVYFLMHRASNTALNLREKFEEAHQLLTIDCNTNLKRLNVLGEHNHTYKEVYDEKLSQYNRIYLPKDKKISADLKDFEEAVAHKSKDIKEIQIRVGADIDTFLNSVNQFSSEISAYLQEDTNVSSLAVPVRSRYREIKEFYDSHKSELSGLSSSFDIIISEGNAELNKFQDYLDDSEYDEARQTLNEIDAIFTETIKVMPQLPLYEASVETAMPNKLDNILTRYREMKDADYVLTHLNIENRVNALRKRLAELQKKLLNFNVNGMMDSLNDIQKKISDMNAELDNEESAKSQFASLSSTLKESTYEIERKYSELMNLLPNYRSVYILDEKYVDEMVSLSDGIENIGILKRNIQSYIDTDDHQPYSVIVDKINKLNNDVTKAERTMKEYSDYLNSLRDNIDYVYNGLSKSYTMMMKQWHEIRDFGNNELLNMAKLKNERYLVEISNISAMMTKTPYNVSEIVSRYEKMKEQLDANYQSVKDKFAMAKNAEQMIVRLNAYRMQFIDCDKGALAAEKAFAESDFERAFSLAKKTYSDLEQSALSAKKA